MSEQPAEAHAGALQIWLDASRPKTLSAALAPVAVGTAMAFEAQSFDWLPAVLCLIAALSVQIGTNFINDYCDFRNGADTAERYGPKRACAAGLVAPATMLRASLLAFGLTLAAGGGLAWLGGWEFMLIAVLGVICGAGYTAGPFPLGYNGLGDLFAFLFFGPVAVAATWYSQVGTLPLDVWIASLAPGCYSIALISVNNLRDADEDRGTGKRTLAVLIGKNFARIEYAVATLTACAVPIVLVVRTERHVFAGLAAIMIIPGIAAMKLVFTIQGRQLNRVLAATGAMMLMHAVVFSIGWVIG